LVEVDVEVAERVNCKEMKLEKEPRDNCELAEEVDKVETVMVAIVPSTIAPCNNPAVEEISCPSSDPITAPEDRSGCPSSSKQTMNQGHMQDSSVTDTFSKVSPSKDTMNVDIFVRDSLAKTDNWDEYKYKGPLGW
jgi:hypothetical protein